MDSGAGREEGLYFGEIVCSYLGELSEQKVMQTFMLLFPFAEADMDIWQGAMEEQISVIMPVYHFCRGEEDGEKEGESLTLEKILWEEAQEHSSPAETDGQEEAGGQEGTEGRRETDGQGEADGQEGTEGREETDEEEGQRSWMDLLIAENEEAAGRLEGSAGKPEDPTGQLDDPRAGTGKQNAGPGENQGNMLQEFPSFTDFVPHAQAAEVDLEEFRDYQTLVQSFYTIDSSTMIGKDQLDVDKLAGKDLSIDKSQEGPQILIYHTHSQEAFADSVEGDRSTTIVGVGDYLTRILTEIYGYQVLHHDGEYDVPSRDKAYSAALPAVTKILEENPSIQVVIDLHRDAVDEKTHLVTEIDGRPTARFMFFNGLSRTRKTGNISYLYNANLDDNLAFSFQLQKKAMEYYPGLTRRIYLKAYRYNMHLRPRNLLIELGAQNNTVEEAMNACDPLAHILDMVLSGQ